MVLRMKNREESKSFSFDDDDEHEIGHEAKIVQQKHKNRKKKVIFPSRRGGEE